MIQRLKRSVTGFFVYKLINAVLSAVEKDSLNLPYIAERLGVKGRFNKLIVGYARKQLDAKNPSVIMLKNFATSEPGKKLLKRILSEVNPTCKKKFISNLLVNSMILGNSQREGREKKGLPAPFLLVISPTMRCNLHCEGCYAGSYTKEEDLPIEVINRVINEAKKLGVFFITISGGEPFVRKDLLKIFAKHNDVMFQIYTNGTLIDKKLAKKLAKLGNAVPAISVEGFKKETDKRRGKGVFDKVMLAMDNLRKERVYFGFSATSTRQNIEKFDDRFIDFYIKKGCFFGWFFQYIPIGRNPDVGLAPTPEQRNKFRENVHEIRKRKPIFVADFWNDGLYSNGCMAGGKKYLHINSKGDVEPCVFVHFAVDNIKDKSLKEVLNSNFFRDIRKMQPFDENLLTPCMIIDHPAILREVCEKNNAYPTHEGAESIIKSKKITKYLDLYSKKMGKLASNAWKEKYCHFVEKRKKMFEGAKYSIKW